MKRLIIGVALLLTVILTFSGCVSKVREWPEKQMPETRQPTGKNESKPTIPSADSATEGTQTTEEHKTIEEYEKPLVMTIPGNDLIGEPQTFEKEGIALLLTDKFVEQKSERGFYAYYVTNFCGVCVLKEEFSLEEGLAERTLEDYIFNVIENNGHTDVKPHSWDGLLFYRSQSGMTVSYSYVFKGSDAFWIVQYLCLTSDEPMLKDLFYLWANTVEVE